MAKLKIQKTGPSGTVKDAFVSPTIIDGAHFGGTGGNTGQTGKQIQGQVHIAGQTSAQGFIVAQKGTRKFRVQDANTNVGDCTLANTPNPAAGQMNILVNLSTITNASLSATSSTNNGPATSANVIYTTTNVTGPVATPRVGDYVIGFTGNASVAQITGVSVVGTTATVTIAVTGNVTSSSATVTDSTYASRITNKFVYDFGNDGNGYPNKFRYRLAVPDATFVQVQSA